MAALTLKSILAPRSANYPTVVALREALGSNTCVLDASGKVLLGAPSTTDPQFPVQLDGLALGCVTGPAPAANALALLLTQLAAREQESRALAAEVLHLYREVNLIEQLSEQLAALLDSSAVGRAALHQAQRLIPATHGVVLITNKESGQLDIAASFTPTVPGVSPPSSLLPTPCSTAPIPDTLSPTSPFTQSILDRGIGEIVNDPAADPRLQPPSSLLPPPSASQSQVPSPQSLVPQSQVPSPQSLVPQSQVPSPQSLVPQSQVPSPQSLVPQSLVPQSQVPSPQSLVPQSLHCVICAPLRTGQSIVGVIALANSDPAASYSAANLKLLNTIALQTAAAFEKSLLAAEMVSNARERAAITAELHAASTVQQLLLQSASRPTPGFIVDSVYLPASEVGGDFFYVAPAPDGSITAIAGDVSGKGITAAMRVAMILGALRRETSHDPAQILHDLNETLLAVNDPLLAKPSSPNLPHQTAFDPGTPITAQPLPPSAPIIVQLGFTTACCVSIALSGHFTLANAGHVNPYQSGRELDTPPSLPLGLIPDQVFELISGHLLPGQFLVLLSDGVPEARSSSGELYGFDRTQASTNLPADQIARRAQHFGQEDDITVLSLSLALAK